MQNKRKQRKRRPKLIAPTDEIIVLSEGQIKHNPKNSATQITYAYTLSAQFPEYKLVFAIDDAVNLCLREIGHQAIIAKLKRLNYEIPVYLENMARDLETLWHALNATVYGRLTAADESVEIEKAFKDIPEFWLYHATDDEIRAITKEIMAESHDTLRDVTLRFFLHFRHMARDAAAAQERKKIK